MPEYDSNINTDSFSNYPTEPIAMSTPEVNWKVDKYLITIKDIEFYFNIRGPGDKYDIYPRSTFDGNKTRVRNRSKDEF